MAVEWWAAVAVADPAKRRHFASASLLPVGCAIVIAALAGWRIAAAPLAGLRETLRVGQSWFLDGLFGLLLVATAVAGRHLIRMLDPSEKRMLGGLACLAAALVLVTPRTNRIFYDEQIYQAIGQNLSDLHLAQMCNDGTVEYGTLQCWRHEYNKQPYGYPHLLSLGYRWLGTSESVAHWLNVLVSGATAGAIFLLALVLTRDRRAAGFGALAFMLLPEQLRWSHSAAAEPSAAFACAVAMLATAVFVESRSTAALVWMVVASSWATYFRPEAILILVVIAVVLLLHAREEIARPRFLWMLSVWVLLLVPTAAHLVAVRNESWGSGFLCRSSGTTCGRTPRSMRATPGFPRSSRCWRWQACARPARPRRWWPGSRRSGGSFSSSTRAATTTAPTSGTRS
jgi:hypothetical protein